VLQIARRLKTEEQRKKVKDSIAEKTKERWQGERMYGQLPRNLNGKLVDIEQSYNMIYLLSVIGLTTGGSSTVHFYTLTIHRTTQLIHRTTQLIHRTTQLVHRTTQLIHRTTQLIHRTIQLTLILLMWRIW
jgi:IS30 family transposase